MTLDGRSSLVSCLAYLPSRCWNSALGFPTCPQAHYLVSALRVVLSFSSRHAPNRNTVEVPIPLPVMRPHASPEQIPPSAQVHIHIWSRGLDRFHHSLHSLGWHRTQ